MAAVIISHLTHRSSTGSNADHTSSDLEARLSMEMGPEDTQREAKRLARKLANCGKDKYDIEEIMAFLRTELDPQPTKAELEAIRKHFVDKKQSSEGMQACDSITSKGRRFAEKAVTLHDFHESFLDPEQIPGQIMATRSLDFQTAIDRKKFVKAIQNASDRNDALTTLPLTLLYIIVFMGLVMAHLDVMYRQEMEHSLESWVDGRDPEKTCSSNCDDVASFWEWFTHSGIPGIFAQHEDNHQKQTRTYYLANKNILVGDVHLERERMLGDDSTTDGTWLINSPKGQEHLNANPLDYQGAAMAAATDFMTIPKVSPSSVTEFQIKFSTVNPGVRMYGLTKVSVRFTPHGSVKVVINADALSVRPYNFENGWGVAICLIDAIYIIMVCHLMFVEIQDVIDCARRGWKEFKEYWGFFNIIDWVNISVGVASITIWCILSNEMGNERLRIITDDLIDGKPIMSLKVDSLDHTIECLFRLLTLYEALHYVMAMNTVSIVLKFFKAYTSNERLRVVTDTFKRAGEDFAHFGIVFLTIFLPFCIIGHVLFGNDVSEFSSVMSSLNTGLVVLMGDFDWYADLTASATYYSVLPSGIPVFFLIVWYVSYMFIVLLVLLNMLLAIIMLHYNDLGDDLKHKKDNPTLWKQVMSYMRMKQEAKSFVSMASVRHALDKDGELDAPVTFDYLCQTIENLSNRKADKEELQRQQAMWLLRFCRKQIELYEDVPDKVHEEGKSECDGFNEVIDKHSTLMQEMLLALRDSKAGEQQQQQQQQQHTNNDDSATLAKMLRRLEEVADNVAKARRDQHGLARRVEQLQYSILGDSGQPSAPNLLEAKSGTLDLEREPPKDRGHEDVSHQHSYAVSSKPEEHRRLPGVVGQGGQDEGAFMGQQFSSNRRAQEEKARQQHDSIDPQHVSSQQRRLGQKREQGQKHEQQESRKSHVVGAKLRDKDKLLRR